MSYLSLPIILQIFCFYHAYRNRKEYHWYLIILFIPLIGSLIYLITQAYNKKDLINIHDSVSTIINPTKKINDLKKELLFSNTHSNQIKLADAYFEINDYENAIHNYELSLNGLFKKDEYAHGQLVISYYLINNLKNAISKGEIVKNNTDFKKSNGYYHLALSYAKTKQTEKAITIFDEMNAPFSNYNERLEFAKYLLTLGKTEKSKEILTDLLDESLRSSKSLKRENNHIFIESKKIFESINN